LRLLLDEMYPPSIALELRRGGHDVGAVTERADQRGLPDAELFAVAQAEGRAVVTENVRDYAPLADAHDGRSEQHFGLVLVPAQRYPRGQTRTVGRLIAALDVLLASVPTNDPTSLRHWL